MPNDNLRPTRRRLLQGGLGVAGVWALAACGAGSSTPRGVTSPSLGSSTTAFLRKAGKQIGSTRVSVLAYASPQADAIKALGSNFTDATGIAIDWTLLDEQSAANKAAVALGSGSGGYDIVQTTAALAPIYVSRGWLQSTENLGSDATSTIPAWKPSAYGAGATRQLSVGGKLYAAPMFLGTQIFYYRTDLFDKAGISGTPASLTDLRGICAKLHGGSTSAIALRSAPSTSQLMFDWSAWLYAFGGKYYSHESGGKYSGIALDSKAAVRALSLYTDLLQKYAPTGATNWSVEDVVRAFSTGQVAIAQEGAVFGGTFNDPKKSQAAGKVGTFAIPAGAAGRFVPFSVHGWGVAKNSKVTQAAWLFAQWATLPDTLTAATQNSVGFSTPPLSSVYESAPYKKRYGFDDYVGSVTKTIATADGGGVSPLKGDPSYLPGTPAWNTIGQKVCEQLSRAVTGQISPAQAIKAAAAAMAS